jgi:ABC-type transporter Mla subunit MlaD
MKTEMQTLEQALAEVMTTRQRLEGIADQLRTTIAALRVEVQLADRAKLAADERAAHAREAAEREQAADQKSAEKRAAFERLLLEVLKPLVDSSVELAWHHCGPKGQTDRTDDGGPARQQQRSAKPRKTKRKKA